MGEEYKDKWYDFLPWILLMKRTAFQKELKTSPAMLTYGRNLSIPGDLLVDPGEPYTEPELEELVRYMQKHNNKLPSPTTHRSQVPVEEPPDTVTHVYTRQHNRVGLEAPYAGPFPVVARPTRSTVQIKVGLTKAGKDRLEVRHWRDLKIAHMRPEAKEASRPARGRPKKTPGATSDPSEADFSAEQTPEEINKPAQQADAQISNFGGKPTRSTRNPNPIYVDSLRTSGPPPYPGFPPPTSWSPYPWSASPEDIAELNRRIGA